MLRKSLLMIVAILTWSLVAQANAPVVLIDQTEDDVARWEVSYHKPEPDMEMAYQVALVSAPELAPLGTEQALQYTFDLRSAWASVERPIDVDLSQVNQVVAYLKVNQSTRVMVMEAYEASGVRWRSKIRLRPDEWNEVVLTPLDFYYLLGGEGRGGDDDLIRLDELVRVGFTVDGHEIDLGGKEIQIGAIVFQ